MSKKRPNSAAAADRFRPADFFLPGLVLFLFTALTTINAIKIPALLALVVTALALLGCMQQLRQRLTWIVAAVALFVAINGISTLYSVSGQFALQDFLPIVCAFCVFVLILAFEPGAEGPDRPPGRGHVRREHRPGLSAEYRPAVHPGSSAPPSCG